MDEEHQSHPIIPVRIISYISHGPTFLEYKPKMHENVFLNPYHKSNDLQLAFKHLVKVGYENAASWKQYIFDYILHSSALQGCFKEGFFRRLFKPFSLTEKGMALKHSVDIALDDLQRKLPDLIKSKSPELNTILATIGGNIYLLESLDFHLLKEFDMSFKPTSNQRNSENDVGCSTYGCFAYFDTYSSSFDSDFSSVDGGSSGCSGTSGCGGGCSGCSGCGGCGGCG